MRRDLFQPSAEAEARLLLLIDGFSSKSDALEGRTKLAKLDFLLRYPQYLKRALSVRAPNVRTDQIPVQETVESRMLRYRYGPWDPAYYAVLGCLIGKGLITVVPLARGVGYKTTEKGVAVCRKIMQEPAWDNIGQRIRLLHEHFNLSGNTLRKFIYERFPEITSSQWGDIL